MQHGEGGGLAVGLRRHIGWLRHRLFGAAVRCSRTTRAVTDLRSTEAERMVYTMVLITMVVGLYGGIIIKQIRQAQIGAISCIH